MIKGIKMLTVFADLLYLHHGTSQPPLEKFMPPSWKSDKLDFDLRQVEDPPVPLNQ